MRGLTVMTACLGLSGCAMPNPGFGFATDTASSGAADTSATSAAVTGDPGTSTVAATSDTSGSTSSATATATATSEPVTSTSDPNTTQTSDPVGTSGAVSSDSGEPVCELPAINDALEPYVFTEGVKLAACAQPLILKGMLSIGPELEISTDPNCGNANPPAKFRLGDGYPMLPALVFPACVTATVSWNMQDNTCKMALLWIAPNVDSNTPLVFGAFSTPPPASFPIKPLPAQLTYCGCPEGNDPTMCCAELQPGELTLQPTNDADLITQFNDQPVVADGALYEFYNLQSWIGPECVDDPTGGRHVDWLAVLTQ